MVEKVCQICSNSSYHHDFLREYQGYQLDIIKVCCTACTARFETLPETTQLEWLRRAMIKTYGETAVIYGLSYDDTGAIHHIGRTKHYKRRMAEYRRTWDCEIKSHRILEQVAFGPLSMERESRWMMHALKHGWPIDNFDRQTTEQHAEINRANEVAVKALLTQAVQEFEPLTAPFETIEPLLRKFNNTRDAHIVHWFMTSTA